MRGKKKGTCMASMMRVVKVDWGGFYFRLYYKELFSPLCVSFVCVYYLLLESGTHLQEGPRNIVPHCGTRIMIFELFIMNFICFYNIFLNFTSVKVCPTILSINNNAVVIARWDGPKLKERNKEGRKKTKERNILTFPEEYYVKC